MSFLTEDELAGLVINRMILHVVGGEDEFEPQPEMDAGEHAEFFLARIQDTAVAAVHEFQEGSAAKTLLERMARDEVTFEAGAQALSDDFSGRHVAASRDGAFFVFELGVADPHVRIYSLIKYDYRQVVELYDRDGRSALRQIVQAFVKEKRAVQKSALVRVVNGVAEIAVSARDRMAEAPDLTDYFRAFLRVARERNNNELSLGVSSALRATFQHCREHLPDGGAPAAFRTAQEHLRNRQRIDEEAVREAVFIAAGRPADENVIAALDRAREREMRRNRLEGLEFAPDLAVFRAAPRRRMRTAEGVTIEFPGAEEDRTVTRMTELDGGVVITVRSRERLVEDDIIGPRTRLPA